VVVYGYLFMLLVNKVVVIGNTVLILLSVVAYAGTFDFGYDPGAMPTRSAPSGRRSCSRR
jgi:hypothetical protein